MSEPLHFSDGPITDEASLFVVTDLKQFQVCPRVVYYERCLTRLRPRTFKMDAGRDMHDDERQRSARRVTRPYGIDQGDRLFEVHLTSAALGLTGRLDELIISADGTRLPVDYKMTRSVSPQHRLQIAAYALLVESVFGITVPRGYIYLTPSRTRHEVEINAALRERVYECLRTLRQMVATESFPPPPVKRAICRDCEFRRFCNDV